MLHARNLSYFFAYVPTMLCVVGFILGGAWAALNLVFVVVFLGLAEWLLPQSRGNDEAPESDLPNLILWLSLPATLLVLGSLIWAAASGAIQGWHLVLGALSAGFHGGTVSIVAAHEFIHRSDRKSVAAGNFLLLLQANPYFFVDHLRVHHRYVGTRRDHATARYGEGFYAFLFRSLGGQFSEALQLEADAARKQGLLPYGFRNYVVRQVIVFIVLLAVCGWALGLMAAAAWLLSALTANVLLEYTNYLEHYGLVRPDDARVAYRTSWQSDTWFSRFLLYDLSRHSDHHVHGARPFHRLRSMDDVPVLPGGYAALLIPALFPPLWFRLLHPRIPRAA
jgi:alkane 1-monooxygenase